MLKFHTKLSKILVYFLFFVCFFGSLALLEQQFVQSIRGNLAGTYNIKEAFGYLLKSYPENEILRITSLQGGGFSSMHYNKGDKKHDIKKSSEYFGNEAQEGLKSGFFKVLHFKFLPAHGVVKQIGKAISTIVALLLILAFFSGLLVLKRRWLFNLKAPNQRGKLHLAHVNFGILTGIFLLWFSISGIGLNYLNDINKLFIQKPKDSHKHQVIKKQKHNDFSMNDEQIRALSQQVENIFNDAKVRLNSDQIDIISMQRKMFVVKDAAELKTRSSKDKAAQILIYQGDKLVKSQPAAKVDNLTFIYNLFYDFHRLHAAPIWLRMLIVSAGFLCCVFLIYALKISSLKTKFNYLNISSSSVLSAVIFMIMSKYTSADFAINAFYICFILLLVIGKFASAKLSMLAMIIASVILICVQEIGILKYFTIFLTMCLIIVYFIPSKRRESAA